MEVKSLENTYVNGELAEFKKMLSELSKGYFIKSLEAHIGELTDIGNRSFSFLDDSITHRRYIVAYIGLWNGKEAALLEVERAGRSLSLLLFMDASSKVYKKEVELALRGLIFSIGSWASENTKAVKFEAKIIKMKHTSHLS